MPGTMPTAEELREFLERLAAPESASTDRERIDTLTALEAIKSGAAAAQARITVAFDASQRAEQAARGLAAGEQGKGVASQVALARRDSPVKGGRHVGLAKALVHEMPHTLDGLSRGLISEWGATILVRETACLSPEHRAAVDAALAGRLGELGEAALAREARKLAYKLDPASALRRIRKATSDRRVSIRPAPDTMSYVTALLPAAQGVAVHAALTKHAATLKATGDPRTKGQIMADAFVERLTGQAKAEQVPVEVGLVMTDRSLFCGDDTPARLVGYGPVPAALGRSLLRATGTTAKQAKAWVRRLYTSPATGDLVAMDSRRRIFPPLLRHFLVLRDEFCRTPWCDAPIRHADHVVRAADGGQTSERNGQGLCEACSYAKEAPGWSAASSRAGPGSPVTVTTPTGHAYTSRAPDPPGIRPLRARLGKLPELYSSSLEERFDRLVASA